MTTPWQPKDTSILQMQSVINYMSRLGYSYFAPTRSFGSGWYYNKGRPWLSLNTAIALHNGLYTECHGTSFDPPFDNLPQEIFNEAHKAKILIRVKMQDSRKRGVVIQDHRVQFLYPEQVEVFFKDV